MVSVFNFLLQNFIISISVFLMHVCAILRFGLTSWGHLMKQKESTNTYASRLVISLNIRMQYPLKESQQEKVFAKMLYWVTAQNM